MLRGARACDIKHARADCTSGRRSPVAILKRMNHGDVRRLLGGISARAFVSTHWHKEPRLIRQALPGFTGVITREQLFELATRDDVASRLVRRTGNRYSLEHGPFRRAKLARLPRRNVTLLV